MDSIFTMAYNGAEHIGPIGTFILLVILLVERALERGWIKVGNMDVYANERVQLRNLMEQLLANQGKLQSHYNDETTDRLDEILKGQQRGIAIIERTAEQVRDGFKEIGDKFNEWDKYGINAVVRK